MKKRCDNAMKNGASFERNGSRRVELGTFDRKLCGLNMHNA